MDTTSLQSTLNKAKEQFENGHAKACVETLKGGLGDLKVGEPEWYRLRNDTSFLLARLSGLERERGMISEQNYMVEWNKLFHSTNQLVLDFEVGVKEMGERETVEESSLYPSELVLALDYEKTDMEEVMGRISRIEKILNIGLGLNERITGTRPGSVVVEMELYAEEIVKIRSLAKLGLVEDMVGFKVLYGGWDWIEGEDFVFWLEGMNFYGSRMSKIFLRKVNLRKTNLGGADLGGADLSGADLSGAYLAGAYLVDTYLGGVDLRSADLGSVNLSRAYLVDADLRGANLSGAKFDGANLSRANFSGNDLVKINFSKVNFRKANLKGAYLVGASLREADLREIDLREANLRGTNLSEANLRKANLSGADLFKADLRGADLREANLREARLRGADLREANLSKTDFFNADFSSVDLSSVDLSRADFKGAKLNDSIFHVSQLEVLELMNVDISRVIFVDDDGANVESLVEVD